MNEENKALPQAGSEQCTQNSGRMGLALAATAGVCILAVDTVLFSQPGLGISVLIASWYALALLAVGRRRFFRRGETRVLLAANLILAGSFAVNSNWMFRLWNLGALAVLLSIHAFALAGAARLPWWRPGMLKERLALLWRGLFGNLGALGEALGAKKPENRRVLLAALGTLAAAALVLVLLPVLSSADALFASVTDSFLAFCRAHLTALTARFLMGLVLTPFVFGLLMALRRQRMLPQREEKPARTADTLPFVIALAALVGLYLLFLAVQITGIVGGGDYLARRGISYAEWARSGFFQMVGVTAVNLTATLAALRFAAGRGRGAIRALCAALLAESLLLLVSAAWRMTLYVGTYGLSFKRFMTYWGMGMMAVFLTAAFGAVAREGFRFCRVAFAAALVGWVVVSCVPVDAIVARDNVERYLAGESVSVDVAYLAYELGYDPLSQLARLSERMDVVDDPYQGRISLKGLVELRRENARGECRRWESWNLSAFLAGRGGA